MHQTIHTGNHAFACPVCQKGFNQRTPLVAHLKVEHPEVEIVIRENATETEFANCYDVEYDEPEDDEEEEGSYVMEVEEQEEDEDEEDDD